MKKTALLEITVYGQNSHHRKTIEYQWGIDERSLKISRELWASDAKDSDANAPEESRGGPARKLPS